MECDFLKNLIIFLVCRILFVDVLLPLRHLKFSLEGFIKFYSILFYLLPLCQVTSSSAYTHTLSYYINAMPIRAVLTLVLQCDCYFPPMRALFK